MAASGYMHIDESVPVPGPTRGRTSSEEGRSLHLVVGPEEVQGKWTSPECSPAEKGKASVLACALCLVSLLGLAMAGIANTGRHAVKDRSDSMLVVPVPSTTAFTTVAVASLITTVTATSTTTFMIEATATATTATTIIITSSNVANVFLKNISTTAAPATLDAVSTTSTAIRTTANMTTIATSTTNVDTGATITSTVTLVIESLPQTTIETTTTTSRTVAPTTSLSTTTSTKVTANRTSTIASTSALRKSSCPACAQTTFVPPQIVIPFYERDLCKVGYTTKALAAHDPKHSFGKVLLLWVSIRPFSDYMGPITEIKDSLSERHEVEIKDFSKQVIAANTSGWLAQQVLKLKIASIVSSSYYVVLDAKNTLIRNIDASVLFTPCNQGKIHGEFRYDRIPEPAKQWYIESARVLNVSTPDKGYWPSSITPMVIHRETALEMLAAIGEDASTSTLCKGPLCGMLGMRAHMVTGMGATEFTLYVLYAYFRTNFGCTHSMERSDHAHRWAVSLFRGTEVVDYKLQMETQIKKNLENCNGVANHRLKPYMFGSQLAALDGTSDTQRQKLIECVVKIYQDAKLYDASIMSSAELIECVVAS